MTREEMRYKLNELRMMLNDGEHGEEQGILVNIISELDKGEWIPISSGELPKIGQRVLATIESLDDGRTVRETTYDKYGFLCGNGVAWQPLPEPYKADKEVSE